MLLINKLSVSMETLINLTSGILIWTLISAAILGIIVKMRPFYPYKTHQDDSIRDLIIFAMAVFLSVLYGILLLKSISYDSILLLGSDSILSMDVNRVIDTVTSYWDGNYRTKVHPLQCLFFQPVAYILQRAGGFAQFRTSQLLCTLSLGLSSGLLACLIWRYTRDRWLTFGGVLLYMFSFSFILHASFPESGGLAAWTVVFPYFLLVTFTGKPVSKLEHLFHLFAAVIALSVTTTNVVHAFIVYVLRCVEDEPKVYVVLYKTLGFLLQVFAIGALLSVAQAKMYPGSEVWFLPQSLKEETGYLIYDVFNLRHLLSVLFQMFGYVLFGPSLRVTDNLIGKGDLKPYFSAEAVSLTDLPIFTLLLICCVSIFFLIGFSRLRRSKLGKGLLFGLTFNVILHFVYGRDLLMYSGNWAILFCLALIILIKEYGRKATVVLFAILPLILVNNISAFRSLHSLLTEYSTLPAIHTMSGSPGTHELARVFFDYTGGYSPGIGTSGVRYAIWDPISKTSNLSNIVVENEVQYSLENEWIPAPMFRSWAGALTLEQTSYVSPNRAVITRVRIISNASRDEESFHFYALVTGRGPAGTTAHRSYTWAPERNAVLIDNKTALLSDNAPLAALVTNESAALKSILSGSTSSQSPHTPLLKRFLKRLKTLITNNPTPQSSKPLDAILLCWEIKLKPGQVYESWFFSPQSVNPLSKDAKDLAVEVGLEPYDPEPSLRAPLGQLEMEAKAEASLIYWENRFKSIRIRVSDERWSSSFRATAAQLAMLVAQNGKPLVSPVNYGTFTRDSVYMIYGLLVSGQWDLARDAIDYLLRFPWSGRPWAEGDAPGQLLWILNKYYSYTGDKEWLSTMVPHIEGLVEALEQARSFGDSSVLVDIFGQTRILSPNFEIIKKIGNSAISSHLPKLNYGTMDGNGLLYVNLFSITGLHNAVDMMASAGEHSVTQKIRPQLIDYQKEFQKLLSIIDHDFEWDHRGHLSALWPTRYDELDQHATAYFQATTKDWGQSESVWPYLDMDAANNFMVAGAREAGWKTIERYFGKPSFTMWKTLNEGGPSSKGYWSELSTNPFWVPKIAMPHGWSIASLLALIRNSLVFEHNGYCVLLSGVPPHWFAPANHIELTLPTEFGMLDLRMESTPSQLNIRISNSCRPPKGFLLRLPPGFGKKEVHILPGKGYSSTTEKMIPRVSS